MAADNARAADSVTFAGGVLDRYRHVCAFVSGRAEADAVLDPFVRDGIDAGDRLLYLVDTMTPASPLRRLRRLGYDPGTLLEERRCEVHTWADTYLRTGGFDQSDMLEQIDGMLGGAPSPRIRLVADMGWAAEREGVSDDLIEFEARANFLHARHRHVVICAYDTSRFDGAFIIDILRTHPMVLIGGILQENPFFVPPAEFLEERAVRGRG
ncbi:MEDS domain-containing protein [Leifsonia sp. fls2-241-R2A-40a]|uniref:MEDS domain-containing protein n=1 Tax=Leifsonia sp. fls2-241-R2A-40a TaxID=3040290 RepID=UPI00254DA4B9|nr:MEDS domain-containing protein [Leifsonia sp. fls2-241-R2A-40a]